MSFKRHFTSLKSQKETACGLSRRRASTATVRISSNRLSQRGTMAPEPRLSEHLGENPYIIYTYNKITYNRFIIYNILLYIYMYFMTSFLIIFQLPSVEFVAFSGGESLQRLRSRAAGCQRPRSPPHSSPAIAGADRLALSPHPKSFKLHILIGGSYKRIYHITYMYRYTHMYMIYIYICTNVGFPAPVPARTLRAQDVEDVPEASPAVA